MKIFPISKVFICLLFCLALNHSYGQIISVAAGSNSTITVSGGEVFADPNDGTTGGVGGDCGDFSGDFSKNYPNCNCVTTTTLCAPEGAQVEVTFTTFKTFLNFDWLAIYDGASPVTAANDLGSATNPSSPDPLLYNSSVSGDALANMQTVTTTFTSTSGCLTFVSRFSLVVNYCGWTANVALIQEEPICGIELNNIITTPESCPNANDGSISIDAFCNSCLGLEYSINGENGPFQSSNQFNNLAAADYTPYIRDAVVAGCFFDNDPVTVGTTPDTDNPTALCNDITTYLDNNGNVSITSADVNNGSSDNCGNVSLELDILNFDCQDIGSNTVTLFVNDDSGNSSSCTGIISVIDSVAPVASCNNMTVYLSNNGEANITTGDLDNGSTDNCSISNYSISKSQFDCTDIGNNVIAFTVEDGSGNTKSCNSNVMVIDSVAPVALCKNINAYIDDTGMANIPNDAVDNGSNDACGIASITLSRTKFSCFELYPVQVIQTVIDNHGNTKTCTATVTVKDNIAPVVSCPADITVNTEEESCGAVVTYNTFSSDNCNNLAAFWSHPSGNFFDAGTTIVTFSVSDLAGNSASCTFNINVNDQEKPTLDCPLNTSIIADIGECTAFYDFNYTAMDNCGVSSTSVFPSPGTDFPVGTTTFTVTAVDNSGNVGSCTFDLNVEDAEKPALTCPLNTTVSTDAGSCTAFYDFNYIAMDNCGIASSSASPSPGTNFPIGVTTFVVTAVDNAGNESSCTFDLTVVDNEAPNPICLDVELNFNGESEFVVSASELYDATNSTDNCGSVNLISTLDDQTVSCSQIGELIEILVTVDDGNGNQNSCTATILVDGLPCGFMNTGGIGCNGFNTSEFDESQKVFNLESDGCSPSFPYTSDSQSFIKKELCGDGYIKAFVSNISGNGFAGVAMRNGINPGDRKVEIGTNKSNRIIKAARVINNYPAYPQELLSYDKFWVKIERQGNIFKAYASADDVVYIPYLYQSIIMDDCLDVGMFVFSKTAGETVIADFTNVEVVESNSGNLSSMQDGIISTYEQAPTLDIGLVPNPAYDKVTLNLNQLIGEKVTIGIFNTNGLLMNEIQLDNVESANEVINVESLPAGTYFVNVKTTLTQQTLKLIKQ